MGVYSPDNRLHQKKYTHQVAPSIAVPPVLNNPPPYAWTKLDYGSKKQLTALAITSAPRNASDRTRLQEVISIFIHSYSEPFDLVMTSDYDQD
jgi:hypothetical protein